MGGISSAPRKRRHSISHNRLQSNILQWQVLPAQNKTAHPRESIECQTGGSVSCAEDAAIEPLQSPKSDVYSGSLQSLASSNDISNKNVAGNQGNVNSSQHIDSQVVSNFLSSIIQAHPQKQQRMTEYSEGKEEDNSLNMTN